MICRPRRLRDRGGGDRKDAGGHRDRVVVVEQANRRTVRSDVDIILCDMFAHIGGEGADPRGLSNQEIAEAIFLSINSVKTYIRTAYRKIGVTRRQLAVIWALQHGFTAEIRRAPVPPQLGVPD
jgi:hypothetical protein